MSAWKKVYWSLGRTWGPKAHSSQRNKLRRGQTKACLQERHLGVQCRPELQSHANLIPCLFQLQKLLESLEIHMIQEVLKKVNREMSLLLSEKSKEEPTLPTGNTCLLYYLKKLTFFFWYEVSVIVGADTAPCYHPKPEEFPYYLGTWSGKDRFSTSLEKRIQEVPIWSGAGAY